MKHQPPNPELISQRIELVRKPKYKRYSLWCITTHSYDDNYLLEREMSLHIFKFLAIIRAKLLSKRYIPYPVRQKMIVRPIIR